MKFIDACFTDKICFIPNDKAEQLSYSCMNREFTYDDEVLCDFLNLYRQDYKLDTTLGNIESFAINHGPLMNDDWLKSIGVPKGFGCIELQNFKDKFEIEKIYYEEVSEWKKHILAFNDLSHLAYVCAYQSRLDSYNVVRYLLKHLIHYTESDGTCSYLFFGNSNFMTQENSGFAYYLPPEVKEFTKKAGNVFLYRENTEASSDSLESRQHWFASHAKKIMQKYEEEYVDVCKVSNINLLGKLQDSLIYWIHQKRPISLCLLCGSFFLPYGGTTQKSGNFCSGLCQSRFYQKREIYEKGFLGATAFSKTDFERLFNSRRRKF